MRIHVFSDLHLLRRRSFELPEVEADLAVCAGDAMEGRKGLDWLIVRYRTRPVVYVPGNHEYYGELLTDLVPKLRAAARSTNIRVADEECVVLGGVRFLCCTLWTDYLLYAKPEQAMMEASAQLKDLTRIRVDAQSDQIIRPVDLLRRHISAVSWLRSKLAEPWSGPTVVVTHHAPSGRSIAAKYGRKPLNASFASNLDELVEESGAAIWIHGHVHTPFDYMIGSTRVICNPLGYLSRAGNGFDPRLVITV